MKPVKQHLNKWFYIDLLLFLVQFVNGWLAWHWWQKGNGVLFVVSGAAFCFGMYGARRLFDFAITGFCFWWIKRKAHEAFKFMEAHKKGLEDESKNID